MMSSCNTYWLKDISVLIKCWSNLYPFKKNATRASSFNALSRLVIIISIIVSIFEKSIYPIIFMFIALAIISAVYYMKKKQQPQELYEQGGLLFSNANAEPGTVKREYGTATTLDGDCTPYGNPNPYQKCVASNQKPLGMMNTPVWGDQFIDKLYNSSVSPAGLWFNRVPDTTTMARQPYALTSQDAVTKWVGLTDNPGTPSLR